MVFALNGKTAPCALRELKTGHKFEKTSIFNRSVLVRMKGSLNRKQMSEVNMTLIPTDLTASIKPKLESYQPNSTLEEYAEIIHDLALDVLREMGLNRSDLLGTAQIGNLWDHVVTENIASENSEKSQLLFLGLVLYKRWHVQRKRRSIAIDMTFRDYLVRCCCDGSNRFRCIEIGRNAPGIDELKKMVREFETPA